MSALEVYQGVSVVLLAFQEDSGVFRGILKVFRGVSGWSQGVSRGFSMIFQGRSMVFFRGIQRGFRGVPWIIPELLGDFRGVLGIISLNHLKP